MYDVYPRVMKKVLPNLIYLSIYLSFYLSMCPSIHLSIYLSIYLSINLSISQGAEEGAPRWRRGWTWPPNLSKYPGLRSREEPGVFGSFEPEPLLKNQKPELLQKKWEHWIYFINTILNIFAWDHVNWKLKWLFMLCKTVKMDIKIRGKNHSQRLRITER